MGRVSSHTIETRARNYVRTVIDSHYENGDALFREITERDYGIDALIEIFDQGNPTGQIAFIQIKGTSNSIKPLSNGKEIACTISASNASYALQSNIPVIVIYAEMVKPNKFYYVDLQSVLTNDLIEKSSKQKNITIHIPKENTSTGSLDLLFDTIRSFYNVRG